MRLKRLPPSREAAKAYVATLPNYFDVEVFRLKYGKYWVLKPTNLSQERRSSWHSSDLKLAQCGRGW